MSDDWDFIRKLRERQPPERTSTWRPDTRNAVFGTAVEIVVREELRKAVAAEKLTWTVERARDARVRAADLDQWGSMHPSARAVVEDAYGGDLYVIDRRGKGRVRFSIEVKGSEEHEGASIRGEQLSRSMAQYLVAITKAGMWMTTMESARRHARDYGNFWVIPYNAVTRLPLRSMFL